MPTKAIILWRKLHFPHNRKLIHNLRCIFIYESPLVAMCPSRTRREMEELPHIYSWKVLHLDQHVSIFDFQPLQIEILAPQEMEWALFWVEKHCFSHWTLSVNYSVWVKNITKVHKWKADRTVTCRQKSVFPHPTPTSVCLLHRPKGTVSSAPAASWCLP